MTTTNIDIDRLKDYEYYQQKLLYIMAGEGLIKFDYHTRWVQEQINKEWVAQEKVGPVMIMILKARRHGVSTYVQSRMFHKCHMQSHRQGITIAADDDGCSYIHDMSQIFYEYLPIELRPKTKYKSKERMTFDYSKADLAKTGGKNYGLKSTLKTVSCTNKAGLGMGNHYIHFSEYAMYRDAEGVRKAVMPTLFQNKGTFCIIESTANGMVGNGEAFYDEWTRAKEGKSIFKPLFYSWLDHEDYTRPFISRGEKNELLDTLSDEEKELIQYHNASYEQLNWRRKQILKLGTFKGESKSGIENFHEQYPTTDEEAFIVSGRNVFEREILKKYKRGCKPPIWKFSFVGDDIRPDVTGDIAVWEEPIKDELYVVSIDPASGEPGSTDFGCIEVLRVMDRLKTGATSMQVAEWHGKVDAEVLGLYAVLIGRWYNDAVLVPEVFGYGHAVLNTILKLDYYNVIKRKVLDVQNRVSTDKYGWVTSPTTKPQMLTMCRYAINNEQVIINSEHLVNEMMIFVREDKITGASAYGRGKDDRVMAYMIGICGVEQEYGDQSMQSVGIIQPKAYDKPKSGDPLYTDNFTLRNEHQKGKSWLDL